MKNHKTTNGIKIALFATFLLLSGLNLSAQYKLELEWQKTPGGNSLNITSITKSDNDSLLFVASANRVRTVRTLDGEVTKIDTVETAYNLIMSRDGKTLAAAGNWGVGILDPQTFKRIYWDSVYSSDFRSLSFNEKQNKIVISSKSYVGKRETFIRVYDLNTKSLFKEFSPSYFGDIAIKNASITDDGKYIIYGYETYTSNPNKTHYFVKIIDLDGKLIKDFGETSSSKFTTTNDGKTLIYFDYTAIHFFDLATMKESEGISLGGVNPYQIEMSNNGKFMLASNIFCDLINKKTMIFDEIGLSETVHFRLNSDNSSLFVGQARNLYKLKLLPSTSIVKDVNQNEFTIFVNNNDLILNTKIYPNPNLTFKILSIDSKIAMNIFQNEIQLMSNGIKFDISKLQSGAYFLQISDSQNVISVLKFLKAN